MAKELELEATGVAKVKSFLAKLKAERHLVEQYLAGHIVKGDAEGARRSLAEAGFPVPDEGLQLNRQQQLLRDSVLGAAERAAKARAAQDIEELDEIREAAAKDARPIAGLGPPGTGKTTVAGNCVDRILESGGRVLYALPTAQQAARVRSRHPAADVDTCAAAFWLWKERADEHLDALAQYDLEQRLDTELVDDGRLLPSAGGHRRVGVLAQHLLDLFQGRVPCVGPGLVPPADVLQLLRRRDCRAQQLELFSELLILAAPHLVQVDHECAPPLWAVHGLALADAR